MSDDVVKKPGPCWGYKSGEEPRIFQDGVRPPGWHDTPQPDKPAKKGKAEKAEDVKDGDGNGE